VARTERLTIDVTVSRDYVDPKRSGHAGAVALFACARRGEVELATAPQGYRLDVRDELAEQLRDAFADEGIKQARQVARVSEVTFPGASLYPGHHDERFAEAWRKVVANWHTHEWKPPERDGNNALLRRYVEGFRRISMTSGGASYYYVYDGLGSVVNLTSSTGSTEWTYAYDPFGAGRSDTQNDPQAPGNPIKFAGEYLDPTGLYDLRARQYDATSGRFLTEDPIEASAAGSDFSTYLYVDDRPTVSVDPTGEEAETATCPTSSRVLREKCAFNFFTASGRHLSHAQAAGLVGNLSVESWVPCRGLDPKCWQCSDHSWTNSNCGVGIAQWTYYARKKGLLAYAGGSVTNALRLRPQLGYVWHELKTGEGYNPRALAHLRNVTGKTRSSVYKASDVVMFEYEHPGRLNRPARRERSWIVFLNNRSN